ncbi:MAG TPA: tRNA 2-thiouridine(34) synthase MnmA, partial [Chitinophagales bacterium]|nr:tRNA 2-thiouridine(34) synthase MnmA [Chitinophagales bacterium]
LVAQKLGIPFQTLDLSEEYKTRIVDYMFAEYEAGRTPNPDVLCNREIKFDIFLKHALAIGADYVATGHYCRKDSIEKDGQTVYRLLAGIDPNKDQSYFLCQLSQEQLSKALFPVGELTKPQVRAIAKDLDLITAEKKDSQGLCFIGKVRLPEFLQQQLQPKKGQVILIPNEILSEKPTYSFDTCSDEEIKVLTQAPVLHPSDGKIIGEHNGAHYYTIGQRKGLGIGGFKTGLFVIGTDTKENIIYLGEDEDHRGLNRAGLFIRQEDIHWIREDRRLQPGEECCYSARIRYRQPLDQCCLYMREEGLYIIFNQLQKGITPGQFAAWYEGDELVGSGVITH